MILTIQKREYTINIRRSILQIRRFSRNRYRGLIIGGFESAWLADLVASFILDNLENIIYRDDDIVFFKGQWLNEDITRWILVFQLIVNDLIDSNGLQFTCEIWRLDTNIVNKATTLNNKITIIRGK